MPLAHILQKESLAPLLRWAAFSAAGMILLECARGFFVGQRRLAALLLLSLIVGLGMVVLIPLAARRHNPAHMIVSQAAITTGAVLLWPGAGPAAWHPGQEPLPRQPSPLPSPAALPLPHGPGQSARCCARSGPSAWCSWLG